MNRSSKLWSSLRPLAAFVLFGLAPLQPVHAADAVAYPSRALRIIVPFTSGSATDTAARILADGLAPRLKVAVVVENKAGASGTIGSAAAAQSLPDGYTFVLTSSSTHSASPALFAKLPYNPTEDFVHITRIATIPMMLVARANGPTRTIPTLITAARTKRLSYAYGSATSQIAGATFSGVAGVPADGIPYKSQPPAVTDLIGGQVDFMFGDLSVVGSLIQSGRLTAVALSAPHRSPDYPDVPTLIEQGFKTFDLVVWVGLAAPKGLPPEVVARIGQETAAVLADPATVAKLAKMGMEVAPNSLADQRAFTLAQRDVWTARARAAGIQPE